MKFHKHAGYYSRHYLPQAIERGIAMNLDILDRILPLRNASHSDVEHYGVDIPMRYSECYARLIDGRVVRLRNSRQFVGWAGMNGSRRLLFADGNRLLKTVTALVESAKKSENRTFEGKMITGEKRSSCPGSHLRGQLYIVDGAFLIVP